MISFDADDSKHRTVETTQVSRRTASDGPHNDGRTLELIAPRGSSSSSSSSGSISRPASLVVEAVMEVSVTSTSGSDCLTGR